MADQTGSKVIFYNNGGFVCNFSVQWDGGQTGRTESVAAGQHTDPIDLTQQSTLSSGTSCWARVYVDGGINHDSGRNFTYVTSDLTTVQYTVTGGTLNPSFD